MARDLWGEGEQSVLSLSWSTLAPRWSCLNVLPPVEGIMMIRNRKFKTFPWFYGFSEMSRLHGCEFINPTYTWATPHLKTTITAAAITTYHYLMKNKLKLFFLPTETQYSLCGKLKFFLEIRYKSNWCITKGIFFISHMSKKERNKITGTFLIVTSSYITFDCFRDVNASFWTI